MTLIKPYHAECLDCGHIMPLKMQLLSYNSWVGIPEEMVLTTVWINKLKFKFLAKLNYNYPLGVGWPLHLSIKLTIPVTET